MANIIDGKAFSESLRAEIKQEVSELKDQTGKTPGLAVILVGEDPASEVYVRNKNKQTAEAGMASFEFKMPDRVSQEALIEKIHELNADENVHGILVQLPLPSHIDEDAIIQNIDPDKDVDGFHLSNVGKLSTGAEGIVPCTPLGSMMMLKDHLGDLSGKKAIVVGRSNIVGKPMAALLLKESCTVTIAHSRTHDLPGECRQADIVIAAVGRPEMVKGDWIKPGAAVIDVGVTEVDGKLVGDVDFEGVKGIARLITPSRRGIGPMTITMLLRNTLRAYRTRKGV